MTRFLFITLFALASLSSARAEDLAIIVAPGVAIDNLSLSELRAIFLMEKTTINDTKLTVLMREKGAPERTETLKDVYQMTDGAYEGYFLQAVFTGKISSAPRMIPSGAAIRKIVGGNPGMIGYIAASAVDASVKAVKIDGHAPGEAGYPLKY